jgi:hypothetical protein
VDIATELSDELLDVLVAGWAAPLRPGTEPDFAIFDFDDVALVAMYHRHQAEIDGEARRRGLARAWIEQCEAELRRRGRL